MSDQNDNIIRDWNLMTYIIFGLSTHQAEVRLTIETPEGERKVVLSSEVMRLNQNKQNTTSSIF